MSGQGEKGSRQRDLILRILRSTRCHPTADWIYQQARQEMSNISLGTVYRNLGTLRDQGKIQELCYGKSVSHFDGDVRDHYHVHCVVCGRIEDVPHGLPRTNSEDIETLTGYQIHTHRLEFSGICPSCQKGDPVD